MLIDIRNNIRLHLQGKSILRILRFIESLKYLDPHVFNTKKNIEYANKHILFSLNGKIPQAIGKLGSVELAAIKKYLRYSSYDNSGELTRIDRQILFANAGVFPDTYSTFERYCKFMLSDVLPEITQLAVWFNLQEARIVTRYAAQATHLPISSLESYTVKAHPWTKWLENKNVLVIHPFSRSIEFQYPRRKEIWNSKEILPDFNLKLISAPHAPSLVKPDFDNWFESLEEMMIKMGEIDFDIALIGAGAYSLPLAMFAKKLGKHGIHIGGALQIYFGIYGRRWENNPDVLKYKNEYWIRPLKEDTPPNVSLIENGCYW